MHLLLLIIPLTIAVGVTAYALSKWSEIKAVDDKGIKTHSIFWWYMVIICVWGAVVVSIGLLSILNIII